MADSVAELPEDERPHAEDNIRLYGDISGVLLFRTGPDNPKAAYLANENAIKPLSTERVGDLVKAARRRVNRVTLLTE